MEDKSIKIGINASYLRKHNTGIGQVTINFLKELAKHIGDRTDVILYLEEDFPDDLAISKKFKRRVFLPFWKRDDLIRKILWEKYLLPKKAKQDKCDIFLSLYQCPAIFEKEISHIMLVHDIIPRLFPEYLNNSRKRKYWKLTELAIKKADRIIANSKRTEKDLVQHLNIDTRVITTEYIDVDGIYKKDISDSETARILNKYELKPGYILAGGGYEVRKNVEGVIRAYKYLIDRNKNEHFISRLPKLVIYGKLIPQLAPLATDVEKLLRDLNLSDKVMLLGPTDQIDMPALFKNAEMFIYPSHYEGFGLPVLEAMSVGTPTVTAKTSSLPEVGGDAVLYCHPDDHRDIAMVIKNILLNHDLCETLSRRSRERSKIFSWNKFTNKIINIIESLRNDPVFRESE